jgi:dTDP-4-amino-4,6-dideoxygalactose transaminase
MLGPMRVPLLDLSEQYRSLAGPIRERLDEIFATQRFVLGPNVERFEKAIAQFIGTPHAIGISSGTDALLVVYMALGIGPDDAIITSPYSFFATAGCVARTGALPLFVDIDRATYNLSPERLAEFLKKECEKRDEATVHRRTGKTIRAIVPVHLFGLCCDMEPISALAAEYRLPLIEDAAQAIGAEYPFGSEVKQAGTMSDYACFSFYPSKNLGAAGDAGLVATNDDARAQLVRSLRQHGMEPRYYHHLIGGNFRLDEIQAAVLDVKLPLLSSWSEARRAAADFYTSELRKAGLTQDVVPPAEPYRDKVKSHHIYHQYVIRTERRDALAKHLEKREIGTAIYYPVGLHLQKAFDYLGYKRGDLPETERAADETLALPIFPEISREAQSYVVEAIAQFFR